MKKKAFVRAVSCACLLAFSTTAFAQRDWQPTLVSPEGGVRGPADPIRLILPQLPVKVLQSIALELDDVDVTALVSTPDGRNASITPPQPLAYGEHSLRLIEYAEDGNIIERGVWTIDVRKSAAFREANLQSNVTVNLVRRVDDKDLAQPEPSANQANGGGQFKGTLAGNGWASSGYIDLLGNSQSQLMPRRDGKIDMGQFLLTGETGPAVAQMGDHFVGPESLIMQRFLRRGISAGVRSLETGSSAVAFSMRTQSITGFQQGLGLGESDNRTDGVVISGRPIASDRDALTVWATYLSGKGADQSGGAGSGIAGDPTVTSGTAASIAADSQLLEKRLRLRGEFATTRYDFDGDGRDTDLDGVIDSNMPSEWSRAHTALVAYTPWHDKQLGGKPVAMNLGIENRRLGTYFRSPANPGGISDRNLVRAFTNINWSGLDVQLNSARETDNVDNLELLPRIETRQHFIAASYTPQIDMTAGADGQPLLPWYGQPSFTATRLNSDQEIVRTPSGSVSGAFMTANVTTVGASFNYASWSWRIMHSLSNTENLLGIAPDTRTSANDISATLRIGKGLTLSPTYQLSNFKESDAPAGYLDRSTKTTTAGVSISYLFSETINTAVNVSRNKRKATDDSADATSDDLTGTIMWTAIRPMAMRPGLNLSLEGSSHDGNDRVMPDNNKYTYQIFLKAAVSWSPFF